MSKKTYLRILIFSGLATLFLSLMSLMFLNRIAHVAATPHRNNFFLYVAENIVERINNLSLDETSYNDILKFNWEMPPPPAVPADFHIKTRAMRTPPQKYLPRRMQHLYFWLLSADKKVLAVSGPTDLPKGFDDLALPQETQQVNSAEDFFRFAPGLFAIKLNHQPPLYLIIQEKEKRYGVNLFGAQSMFTFTTVAVAFLLAFVFTFVYLRRKSSEARAVLLKLEQGNLKARFEIHRFDEFAGLAMDFNRMAGEIEKLVSRVHTTEGARKNLLQELGHDLRTPMTSLTTSFETLRTHYDKLSIIQRRDLFDMAEAEIKYFRELLEKLLMIAGLDEPSFKTSTEVIDVRELITQEIKLWQMGDVQWQLMCLSSGPFVIVGDPHLFLRLIKNAFDNTSRYAQRKITVSLSESPGEIVISLSDDGPGLTAAALASFGKRNEQRKKRETGSLQFSLGLGSVIMKTIAELHGGSIKMSNRVSNSGEILGAELQIYLPKAGV